MHSSSFPSLPQKKTVQKTGRKPAPAPREPSPSDFYSLRDLAVVHGASAHAGGDDAAAARDVEVGGGSIGCGVDGEGSEGGWAQGGSGETAKGSAAAAETTGHFVRRQLRLPNHRATGRSCRIRSRFSAPRSSAKATSTRYSKRSRRHQHQLHRLLLPSSACGSSPVPLSAADLRY
jgi:hypothetical protein